MSVSKSFVIHYLGLRYSIRGLHIFPAKGNTALVGEAQWIECWPANQRVIGSIPSQGTCLGCRPGPQWGAY